MTTSDTVRRVDHSALRTNQAFIIGLLVLSFVLNSPALALFAGLSVQGWVLVWLVAGLAALNLFAGFCTGCFVYYQLNRLGVPGFRYSSVGRQ